MTQDSPAVARLRAMLAAKKIITASAPVCATVPAESAPAGPIQWNAEQTQAINYGMSGQEFCLIGAAGTGKTTTVKEIANQIKQRNQHKIVTGTSYLREDTPAIAFVSFTNRAVRNIRRALKDLPDLAAHCLTIHKLLEYYPNVYEIFDESLGDFRKTMEFVPKYTASLPITDLRVVVVDESSMVDTVLFQRLKDACPNATFIFIGDLNQLPPVFGDAILGYKLAELPVVELTRVYRQALESPIVRFQHEFVLKGKLPSDSVMAKYDPTGKLRFIPLKSEVSNGETMARALANYMLREYDAGLYTPGEDIILIPFNKSFGTIILNREIAQWLGDKRGAVVHEIIGGGFKHYYAIGDVVVHEKEEWEIVDISVNPKYLGQRPLPPSKDLLRTGKMRGGKVISDIESDEEFGLDERLDMMFSNTEDEEIVDKASHVIILRHCEDPERKTSLFSRGEINSMSFGYAITVHKSQGSEWRKVYFIATNFHSVMLSREILYTGMTRAREELQMIYSPQTQAGKLNSSIAKAIRMQKIPGTSWRDKVEFFKGKQESEGQRV